MKVLLAGGGTGGATTPLIALAEALRSADSSCDIRFVGSERGPERGLAEQASIPFTAIHAGKLRRYFSFRNFSDLFHILQGFFDARSVLREFRPDVIVTVGSFVAVPVVWAGKFTGIPSVVHQQDIQPGLANRLCTPAARVITVAFPEGVTQFGARRAQWIGNPVRQSVVRSTKDQGLKAFSLNPQLPVLLIVGGGTGSLALNRLISTTAPALCARYQLLHITGVHDDTAPFTHPHYQRFEFLHETMAAALAAADMVISRAGLATISELAVRGLPSLIIPMPDSHQEKNAAYIHQHDAAVVLDERSLNPESFIAAIDTLWTDAHRRQALSTHLRSLSKPDAAQRLASVVMMTARQRTYEPLMHVLQQHGCRCVLNEPLSKHSNFKIGGPADLFITCTDAEQVIAAVTAVRAHAVPLTILGGGTNVVFSDAGVRGAVIAMKDTSFSAEGDRVTVGAGMATGAFVQQCHAHGLTGAEFLVGIYGTVGGAVRGNAGSFGTEMKDCVVSCEVLTESGTVETWNNARFQFGYRDSIIKHSSAIVVTIRMQLTRGSVADAKKKMIEYLAYKKSHQPINLPSAGCMFKNVPIGTRDDLKSRFASVAKDGQVPAWAFIKDVELVGKTMGGIQISEQHANFFVNTGNGTAEQIVMLTSLVKQRVRDSFGVQLEEEVQFLGF